MTYLVYIIKSGNRSYVGMTNNFFRRIQQHNGILKGGAKYTTRMGSNWYPICIIDGFLSMKEACQCEWAIKHHKKRYGCQGRVLNLESLWARNYWTKNSPQIDQQLLCIYIDDDYKDLITVDTKELYWK